MKASLIFFALIFLVLAVKGQELEIYGYFEPQFSVITVDNSSVQLQSNKLRLDFSSEMGNKVTFGANFIFITYHGTTNFDYFQFLPQAMQDSLSGSGNLLYPLNYSDQYILDNAFAKLSFKYADLTLGKRQISLGTGYAWNPSDLFNTKDLLDPTYEQPGHNILRLDIPIESRTNFSIIYQPENGWINSGKLVRAKTGFSRFDFSIVFIERQWSFTDFHDYRSWDVTRQMYGADFVGEFLGLGVWGEFAYNVFDLEDDFREMVIGADYTCKSGTHFLCEYYQNNQGRSDQDDYDLNDWMRWMLGQNRSLSRDQVYLYVNHPATDLLQVGSSVITCLSDGSVMVVPTIAYSLFENVDVSVFGNVNIGKDGSNYSSDTGGGGFVRLRLYF